MKTKRKKRPFCERILCIRSMRQRHNDAHLPHRDKPSCKSARVGVGGGGGDGAHWSTPSSGQHSNALAQQSDVIVAYVCVFKHFAQKCCCWRAHSACCTLSVAICVCALRKMNKYPLDVLVRMCMYACTMRQNVHNIAAALMIRTMHRRNAEVVDWAPNSANTDASSSLKESAIAKQHHTYIRIVA